MKIQIRANESVPRQSVANKLVELAVIAYVYMPSIDPTKRKDESNIGYVSVGICNLDGGSSTQKFTLEEFKKFSASYRPLGKRDLVGQPVISVYNRRSLLTGLVPLGPKIKATVLSD